jgi:uncharacterized YigZ family protein
MQTLLKVVEDCYEINKSKFLSFGYPVVSDIECREILNNLNKKFNDATHICYAYVLSSPQQEKASDDGEPAGTAGKPILELIKKRKLTNLLVVVVRYFGGIKLGAGGLVRAYTQSANLVLKDSNLVEVRNKKVYRIITSYLNGEQIIKFIKQSGGEVLNCVYNENIKIEFDGDFAEELVNKFDVISIEKVE